MRPTALAFALVAGSVANAADSIPAGPLPGTVRPSHYRLDLTILPDQARFSGVADIDVDVAQDTREIYLHGNGLEVTRATFAVAGGAPVGARWEQVDPTGVARLAFDRPVSAGKGTLHVEYAAPFGKGGDGLYRSDVAGESYAFTQFEPIDARRMFPGFDEPGFKTPFDVAVTTRAGNAVIANAPLKAERAAGEGLKRVEFETTLPLPTYLVALAVGPLDVVEGPALPPNAIRTRPLPLRGVATKGKGPRLAFALANTRAIVEYLERYFDVAFPYPKLDLIASPDFGGGMENAGAIMYGDPRLLLDDSPTFEQRRGFGGIHAHEIAHQWFGDLVTPKWWDDIWLNESFANWMGFKAGHAWQPTLGLDVVPALQMPAAMELDSRIAARQIRNPVEKNLDIQSAFDGITYLKGGAVLGMFESWLGEERFRAGIRTHMRRFPNGVADVEDFMASLAEGSGRPDVVPAFRSFIDQPGVPLVSARLDCAGGKPALALKQSRYLPVGSKGDPARSWQLPFCVRYGTASGDARECVLLKEPGTRMPLAGSCPTWIVPNAGGAGYYRFDLDDAGWRALAANLGKLTEPEALAAADSLSAAYQANRISTESMISAAVALSKSPHPQVMMAPDNDLIRLRDYLAPEKDRDEVMAFMRATYRPQLAKFGPEPGASVDDAAAVERALVRTNLLRFLALEAGDSGIRAGLANQARRYIGLDTSDGAPDKGAVEPALVDVALQSGVQEGGMPFAEALIARMIASDDIQFRGQAATALGSTDDAAVGKRVRDLLLDPRLRAREPTTLAFALAARPAQRRATIDWFKANHDAFIARISHFGYRWLPRFGAGFCTLPEREEVKKVFTPLLPRLDGAERTLAETLEGIELCAALADAKGAEVARYFSDGKD
jgi:alanyl aminopeptidase